MDEVEKLISDNKRLRELLALAIKELVVMCGDCTEDVGSCTQECVWKHQKEAERLIRGD